MITLYLQEVLGKDGEYILGDGDLKTLRLSSEAREKLRGDFKKIPRQSSTIYRDWETWLKGQSQYLPITFKGNCAIYNPEAVFLMPIHPFITQAASHFEKQAKLSIRLSVISDKIIPGLYPFAVYQWKFQGIRQDQQFKIISTNNILNEHLDNLIPIAEDWADGKNYQISGNDMEILNTYHHSLWDNARNEHSQYNKQTVEYRRESLSTSHRARIGLLNDQLHSIYEEKIRRMRQAQIDAAEADYARHNQDLNMAIERVDLIANPIAYGILKISRN
jgi:hypothetical protein